MKLRLVFCAFLAATAIFGVKNGFADAPITSKPVFVPDLSHESDHLGFNVMTWDATMKATNVPADTAQAHFVFSFTNVTTNDVVIAQVHPSCGCTTAQLPSLPWTVPAGTGGQIGVTVNLAGKFGTLVKTVHIGTDKGSRDLIVQITIAPEVFTIPSDADRMKQMQIAKIDRQAVFKNDCATCHEKRGEYQYGKALYDVDCGVCHEAEHRASMVPDLHALKVSTNEAFWRTWIAHGKAGTFMPAFSQAEGGPLTDMQISSLAVYLNDAMPSKVPAPQ